MLKRLSGVWCSCSRSAFAVAVLVAGPSSPMLAQPVDSGVAPPHSVAFGHTYGGWSAEWWRSEEHTSELQSR